MQLDYQAYEALFNSGDDVALVERFFAPDCVMLSGSGARHGRGELLAFLRWAHDGVREVMRPQRVAAAEGLLFAEVDMDFHATKPRPDFPFAALLPGDLVTVKFLVSYELDAAGRIAVLKSMTWPAEQGVTKLPRLGSHPSQLAAFHAYAAAFSHGDCERFPRFYTDDVVLTLPSAGELAGKDGIVGFYRPMFVSVRESVRIDRLVATDERIEVSALSRFTAIADAPDFVVAPLARGEFIEVPVDIAYSLRGGLISRIAVSRAGVPSAIGRGAA